MRPQSTGHKMEEMKTGETGPPRRPGTGLPRGSAKLALTAMGHRVQTTEAAAPL